MTNDAITRVLLVDDQRFIGMAIGRLLAGESDLQLHCCYTPTEALADANRLQPAVILQDLVLPGIDGLTLVDMFRKNPSTAATPIVVLSGNDDPASKTRALAAGANDYMVKLPDKSTLIASIRRYAIASTALGAGAAPPASASSSTGSATTPNRDLTLDRSVIASMRGSMGPAGSDLVAKLIDQFIQEATLLVDRLTHAAPREDVALLKAAAHGLAGTSSTMGARRLASLGAELEAQASRANGKDGVIDPALITAICEELGRVRRACVVELQDTADASIIRS